MKKPEMKVIHFESGDVITTSAQPKDCFIFSGVSDGRAGNIKMIFNGEDRTSQGNEIVSYLKNQVTVGNCHRPSVRAFHAVV